ncbi:hypothetical protein [Actinosynnema sp. NPDC023587]|uniref:hypothetical protein n=1 Tax=Actinosynnema sp. NPDC023587 TaxID=3154695 RepID=UPI0033F592E3
MTHARHRAPVVLPGTATVRARAALIVGVQITAGLFLLAGLTGLAIWLAAARDPGPPIPTITPVSVDLDHVPLSTPLEIT